ncbi:hypothetical protein B0H66DRAFT_546392 [Apodospora peruviana]|uniref:Uncharacterized protein n=1 Tax=Apodospora peruviana TaxID=516989 RepID=A0AAE0IUT1_9PEZI|nr:hypothetical protein B0H66DRAFT_546392 [Apodospora peruviana]
MTSTQIQNQKFRLRQLLRQQPYNRVHQPQQRQSQTVRQDPSKPSSSDAMSREPIRALVCDNDRGRPSRLLQSRASRSSTHRDSPGLAPWWKDYCEEQKEIRPGTGGENDPDDWRAVRSPYQM